jgi:hypothetical protein
MTTSGITTWPLTAQEIVTQAAYELGAVSSGETLSGEDMEDGLLRLNAMLNYWSGEGNLYREATGTLVISGGTGALPADVAVLSSVRHVVSATNHRQLVPWKPDDLLCRQDNLRTDHQRVAGSFHPHHA